MEVFPVAGDRFVKIPPSVMQGAEIRAVEAHGCAPELKLH